MKTLLTTIILILLNPVVCNTADVNIDTFTEYEKLVKESPTKFNQLTSDQIKTLFKNVRNNPVTRVEMLSKYDPKGIIGFCFGRSMAAHLMARQIGLAKDSIKKIFTVGHLGNNGKLEWRFHVTTIVMGEIVKGEKDWIAIDPGAPGPMTITKWLEWVHLVWDTDKKTTFYITPANAIIPDLSIVPDLNDESGEYLIEFKFDPQEHPQFFRRIPKFESKIFFTRLIAADHYFALAKSDANHPFYMDKIGINDFEISYNGYFEDLMKYLAYGINPHSDFDMNSITANSYSTLYSGTNIKHPIGGFKWNK